MADTTTKQGPLAGLDLPATDAVTVTERPFLGKLVLRGDGEGFRDAVRGVLQTDLPPPLQFTTADACTVLWQGPDQWLVVGDPDDTKARESALRGAVDGIHAAVTDVSSGTTVLRLSGPAARDVLYKGCALDLDPPAFAKGSCAPTRIAAFAVTLVQVDETPAYEIIIARSLARTFGEWLVDACREFTAEA